MGKRSIDAFPTYYTEIDHNISVGKDEVFFIPALNTNRAPTANPRPAEELSSYQDVMRKHYQRRAG